LHRAAKRYIDIAYGEEFSICLSAFNEAIDRYDLHRQGNFYKYSYIIINHRIIDFYRKSNKHDNHIPFSIIEDKDHFEQKYLISDSHYQYEKIEFREDFINLQQNLLQYGITWDSLIKNSPKHKDSKRLCIKIAKVIIENDDLFSKFTRTKRIPQSDLISRMKVHRRTLENHRIYIIAVCLILSSDQYELKDFVVHFEERGNM
jgi:RNA polymerase sigma factor